MSINTLTLQNFRNITEAELSFSKQCNIIFGDNGSGKTNILESIYYLSLARSFRTTQARKIINTSSEALQVVGKIQNSCSAVTSVLGIRRSSSDTQIRINGETVKQSSQLAAYLPVQVIHPQGHRLLEQGPKQRRQFLDWGVFHVEPSFLPLWHDYAHTLKQRNAALRQRQQAEAIRLWDARVIELGEKMTRLRQNYLDKLRAYISHYCLLLMGEDVSVDYRPGWGADLDFPTALRNSLEQDQQLGFTRTGPHRADLIFKSKKIPVQDYFSRGQQKLLVCALRLAQTRQLKDEKQQDTVLLLDDLAAELDEQHRRTLLDAAFETAAQIFITTTELDLLKIKNERSCKVFHVEHGQVTEMVQSNAQMETTA